MYAAADDYGTSYYFRGAVNNNWVSFAGFYWRIIRINGDNSIRMIYTGTTAPTESQAVVMTGTETQIAGTQKINNNSPNTAEYVGYMYTIGELHGHSISSTIKNYVEDWYTGNLSSYSFKLSDSIYCNDRSVYSGIISGVNYSGSGIGASYSWYGTSSRLISSSALAPIGIGPSLICPIQSDAFTVSDTTHGNAHLTYPIGLITADEVSMAGATVSGNSVTTPNTSYYLYTTQYYWTISPSGFYDGANSTEIFIIGLEGEIFVSDNNTYLAVRPVISLKSDVTATGTGVWNDPYVVQ
jgi:hypothetical protein